MTAITRSVAVPPALRAVRRCFPHWTVRSLLPGFSARQKSPLFRPGPAWPSPRHSHGPCVAAAGVRPGVPGPPSLGLTCASTTLRRKLRVTSSCTAAAAPCPAPARRTPWLMLISPHAAASRVPRGRGTAGGPGDNPRGRFPAAERLQDQRFARRSGGGRLSPKYPAAASEAGKASSPTSSPRRPRPQLSRLIGHAPRARGLVGVVVLGGRLGAAAGRRSPQTGGLGNYNCESRPASPRPRTPRWPMRRDHAGLQNTRRCGRGKERRSLLRETRLGSSLRRSVLWLPPGSRIHPVCGRVRN